MGGARHVGGYTEIAQIAQSGVCGDGGDSGILQTLKQFYEASIGGSNTWTSRTSMNPVPTLGLRTQQDNQGAGIRNLGKNPFLLSIRQASTKHLQNDLVMMIVPWRNSLPTRDSNAFHCRSW